MTTPIATAICFHCDEQFAKLFAHQKFCGIPCAFWSRVTKGEPFDCWLWTGGTTTFGYGEFSYNGRLLRAHRVSYELHHGTMPNGMGALHTCDVAECCNPRHLYAGTQANNMADMRIRYRGLKKLTIEQVLSAEQRIQNGEPMLRIAKDFGVSHPAISRIKRIMIREGKFQSPGL